MKPFTVFTSCCIIVRHLGPSTIHFENCFPPVQKIKFDHGLTRGFKSSNFWEFLSSLFHNYCSLAQAKPFRFSASFTFSEIWRYYSCQEANMFLWIRISTEYENINGGRKLRTCFRCTEDMRGINRRLPPKPMVKCVSIEWKLFKGI